MRWAFVVVVAGGVLWASTLRAQPAATVDRYVPSEAPGDGFALSAPHVPRHLSFAFQLHMDYANDPLVYEATAGDSNAETTALVAHELRAHLGAGLGLLDFLYVYAVLPVDLVFTGTAVGELPTATGFGAGDLALGVRAAFFERPAGALAVQARLGLPTGADGDDGRPGVAGEGGVSGQPELLGEVKFGGVHLLANVGMLFRPDFSIPAARFGDELTYGAGGFVVLPPADRLQVHVELFGSTPLDDVGSGTGTVLELLLGAKVLVGAHWSVGTSGGFGVTRGYGSPDFRWASLLIWEQPARAKHADDAPQAREQEPDPPEAEEPAPVAAAVASAPERGPVDADRDGLGDDRDACPDAPGLTEHDGCPQHVRFEPETGVLVLLDPIEFESERPELRPTSLSVVDELALAIQGMPDRVVRLEAHTSQQRRREPMALSKARARVLGEALIARGIVFAQLEAIACGANRPLRSGLGLRRGGNERIEARVIKPLPPGGMPSSLGCEPVALPQPAAPAPSDAAPEPIADAVVAPSAGSAAALLAAIAQTPDEDRDGDGLANSADRCPLAPGPAKAAGCPATHDVDLAAGSIALRAGVDFAKGGTRIRSHSAAVLPEVAATLRANPEFKLRIVVLADGADSRADALSRDRASAVRQRLMTEHIDGARLQAFGCPPSTASAARQGDSANKPVQLWLLDPAPASGVRSSEGCVASD